MSAALLIVCMALPAVTCLYCRQGQFTNNTNEIPFCQPCPDDSYMDDDMHQHRACKQCVIYTQDLDHVVHTIPCTRTSQSKIAQCKDYFYVSDKKDECLRCEQSDFDVREGCSDSKTTTQVPPSTMSPVAQTPNQSNSELQPSNFTHCNNIINTAKGCIDLTFKNKQCLVMSNHKVNCLNCPQFKDKNSSFCSQDDSSDSGITVEVIAGIIIPITIVIAKVVIIIGCIVYRRKRASKTNTYRLNNPSSINGDKQTVEEIASMMDSQV